MKYIIIDRIKRSIILLVFVTLKVMMKRHTL